MKIVKFYYNNFSSLCVQKFFRLLVYDHRGDICHRLLVYDHRGDICHRLLVYDHRGDICHICINFVEILELLLEV